VCTSVVCVVCVYQSDNCTHMLWCNCVAAGTADQEGIYDNKSGVLPNRPLQESGRSPSFDDPTYASIWKKPAAEKPGKSNIISLK